MPSLLCESRLHVLYEKRCAWQSLWHVGQDAGTLSKTAVVCRRTGETGAIAERMQGGMQDMTDTVEET